MILIEFDDNKVSVVCIAELIAEKKDSLFKEEKI
jgi:hypothetical protein